MHDLERYGLTLEDLPAWLRPRQNRFDYALLGIILLCLVVAWPWLQRSGMPNTMSGWESIFRIAEVADSLQEGDIYPRWAPHYHFSYGSPVFHYLAPAPHYLGGLHYLLTESSPLSSLKFLIITSIVMAGTGMFSFGRGRWGTLAGFCMALVYLLAPPMLLTLPYITVDLPLLFAAGIFPWLLRSIDRVLSYSAGRDIAGLAMLTALQVTSHTLMGWLFLGMAVVWLMWLAILEREKYRLRTFVGLVAGIGLAAVYWLPALAERDTVYWNTFEYIDRPLRLSEVLGLLPEQDFLVFNPDYPASLGLATWGLFILGSLICAGELTRPVSRKRVLPVLPFILIGVMLLWIATRYESAWLDSLTKFPLLSRPDLLIPVTACCAILAGQCAAAIDTYPGYRPLKIPAMMLLTGSIIGAAFYILKPPPFVPYRFNDAVEAHLEAELRGAFSGSFRTGQLLPKDVEVLPAPSFTLLDSYKRDQVEKLSRNNQLVRSGVEIFSHGPTHDRMRLSIFEDNTKLEFLTLNFPGWEAEFRNQSVPVESVPGSGLILVTLPEGRGTLKLSLGSTPIRTAAAGISFFSLLILPLALIIFRQSQPAGILEDRFTTLLTIGLTLMAIMILSFARNTIPTRSRLETITPFPLVFEGGIDLAGYESETTILQPGQVTPVTLYWESIRPNLPNYHINVSLREKDTGAVIHSETHRAPGGWPTGYWQANRYVQDRYWLTIPDEVPPGEYQITLQVIDCEGSTSVYSCDVATPLQAFEARGRPLGDSATLPIMLTVH